MGQLFVARIAQEGAIGLATRSGAFSGMCYFLEASPLDQVFAMHSCSVFHRCAVSADPRRWLLRQQHRAVAVAVALSAAVMALLTGCSSIGAGFGIGIPVGPVSVGVGVGSGGLSAGVGTGWGPLGVGVGVNQRGQVLGSAGVGMSAGVGRARVGTGIGTSTVLHDPAGPQGVATSNATAPEASLPPAAGETSMQWRDASGQVVPVCRVEGHC